MMDLTETIRTTPIQAEKSVRVNEIRGLTSGKAGKILPISFIPLLREDRVSRGAVRLRFEMAETAAMLMNAINVTCYAHFIPFLAFDRFNNSIDQLNRSYMGEPAVAGGAVTPFFERVEYAKTQAFWRTLGIHARPNQMVNGAVLEAYNSLVNWRYRARSQHLPQRLKYDATLAAAFWKNPGMDQIVASFDQAMIDGEVPLNLIDGILPVRGLGVRTDVPQATSSVTMRDATGKTVTYPKGWSSMGSGTTSLQMKARAGGYAPDIFAEMKQGGLTVSLANIELAKKTAAFAAMRKEFSGLAKDADDDYMIDLLMQAVRVPEAQMNQPILLDRKSTLVGYTRRFATDAGNLDKSVTTGETSVDLRFRTPAMNTGGIILITAEIVPEQMFERKGDPFILNSDVDSYPQFLRDFLDPQKVDVVQNKEIDVLHSQPNATFGYTGLNQKWNRRLVNIGGKFFRQPGDPFSEDRQRLWSVEALNPKLTRDFYLATNLSQEVFADRKADNFEVTAIGGCEIVGNTVFGRKLMEDGGEYEAVTSEVEQIVTA